MFINAGHLSCLGYAIKILFEPSLMFPLLVTYYLNKLHTCTCLTLFIAREKNSPTNVQLKNIYTTGKGL